jgi:hypothetical protein
MFKLKNLFLYKNKNIIHSKINIYNNLNLSRNFSSTEMKQIIFNNDLIYDLQKQEKNYEINSLKFKFSEKNIENLKLNLFMNEKNKEITPLNFNKLENKKNFEEIFDYEIEEEKGNDNNINIIKFQVKNYEKICEIFIPLRKNLFFDIFFIKNLKIFTDINENENNLFDREINLENNIYFSLENSSIEIINNLLVKNLEIKLKNSEFISSNGKIFSFNKKLFRNFKNFEDGFDRNLLGIENNKNKYLNNLGDIINIKNENENILTKQNPNNYNYNYNPNFNFKERNILINTENSKIYIKDIKNFNNLKIESIKNNDINYNNFNEISLNKLSINKFEFYFFEGDKVNINLFHLVENSLFKIKKIEPDIDKDKEEDFIKIKFKIHPLLIFNLNVYNLFNNKFQKHLFFDNEGYSFCPTIIFDIDRLIPKNFLVGYYLISYPKIILRVFKLLILLFIIKIFFLCENNNNNLLDNDTNLNTLNNLHSDITEYKMYQMLLKKKLNNFLNDK